MRCNCVNYRNYRKDCMTITNKEYFLYMASVVKLLMLLIFKLKWRYFAKLPQWLM